MKKIKINKKTKGLAISQIIVLIVSIVAFSFIVGGSFETVSAQDFTQGSVAAGGGIDPNLDPPIDKPGFLKKFFEKLFNPTGSSALAHAAFVSISAGVLAFITTGLSTGDADKALRVALRVSIGTGIGFGLGHLVVAAFGGPGAWFITGAGIVGGLLSGLLSRDQDRRIVFECSPWKAQSEGKKCTLCNDGDFPCTEYQCRSLGASCELRNKDTDEPRCVWNERNNVDPPVITPWVDALTDGYTYDPLLGGQTGVEIKYGNSACLPAFTPFTFGIELDKEAYCKIDYERKDNFSEMDYDFGGTNRDLMQHIQHMTFPGAANFEEEGVLELPNDGELEFYVRCEAVNGVANREEFLFKFCIDPEDDITPPKIRGFNWADGAPIAYFDEDDEREVGVQVYTNEPAQCKWSHEDKDYETMKNSLACQNSLIRYNAQLSYTCSGELTGLENGQENKFYFRCEDVFGKVNKQSKTLTLVGTRPLSLDEISPDDGALIKGSSNSIKVTLTAKTSAGYNAGESICSHSETGTGYIRFSDTESHQHSTNIWLDPGDYSYFVQCIDLAGNSDTMQTSFTVETDTFAPVVVRVFHSGTDLIIITNEEASCVYDNKDCLYEFEEGLSMLSSGDGKTHSTEWDPEKSFYILCADEFGNRPTNACSMVAQPFEV